MESSSIALWDLRGNQNRPTSEYHLPGPVVDGVVDDGGEYIRCAITVGTCSMYISILEIGICDGIPIISELSRVQNASHVRLFKGSLVGFASKCGDDTYAYVAKWDEEKEYRLFSPPNLPFSPLPQVCYLFLDMSCY